MARIKAPLALSGCVTFGLTLSVTAALAAPAQAAPATTAVDSTQAQLAAAAISRQISGTSQYFSGAATAASPSYRVGAGIPVDATARAIKKSFEADRLAVLRSTSQATNVQVTREADGTLIATSDVTYSWLLKSPTGTPFESSTTDTYRFTLSSTAGSTAGPDGVIQAQILPSEPDSGPEIAVPAGTKPASTGPAPDHSRVFSAAAGATATGTTAATTTAAGAAAGAPSSFGIDQYAAANYALLWTDAAHRDSLNPDYPRFRNNSANLMSQSLRAGGWDYRQGLSPKNSNNWAPNLRGNAGPSYTWGGARQLAQYVFDVAKWPALDFVEYAGTGDILFADWDPAGKPDGRIDQAAMVTGFDPVGQLISQKSSNRHNLPLSTYRAIAYEQGRKKIDWYVADALPLP